MLFQGIDTIRTQHLRVCHNLITRHAVGEDGLTQHQTVCRSAETKQIFWQIDMVVFQAHLLHEIFLTHREQLPLNGPEQIALRKVVYASRLDGIDLFQMPEPVKLTIV